MTDHQHIMRFPLPLALIDPAFQRCTFEAISIPELVENFDRLYGCQVSKIGKGSPINQMIDEATGFQNDQLRQFAEFVHECIYMRLPDEAIHALRIEPVEAT